MNKKLEQFYIEWKANLEDYLKGYAFSKSGVKMKTRFAFLTLEKYFNKFINDDLSEDEKIIILPGVRGVGKTTLLSQLYFFNDFISNKHCKVKNNIKKVDYKIYISADRLLVENISLKEFFDFLEKDVLGNFLDKKILLLIDEIQYDQRWSLFLILIFD